MPAYDFKCKECGAVEERILPMKNDRTKEKCSKCKAPMAVQLCAAPVHYKGSGWYVTDYAKNPKPNG